MEMNVKAMAGFEMDGIGLRRGQRGTMARKHEFSLISVSRAAINKPLAAQISSAANGSYIRAIGIHGDGIIIQKWLIAAHTNIISSTLYNLSHSSGAVTLFLDSRRHTSVNQSRRSL